MVNSQAEMNEAILKTLAYFDYFGYPLKAWEIHKWLIQKKASLKQTEKALRNLVEEKKIFKENEFYLLRAKKNLVKKRLKGEGISKGRLFKAKLVAFLIKSIPWIKLVGVSGSLSVLASQEKDDIDLVIVTAGNRIWLSRLLLIFLTTLTGLRRKRREKLLSAAGKICINLILEVDNLAQKNRNIYVAHEVLQMRLLWQRQQIYSRFLHDNQWVFRYLPNWKSGITEKREKRKEVRENKQNQFIDRLEELAKKLQLKIMNSPSGAERIESGALYFHPEDKGVKVLEEYKKKTSSL